jgi:hypothetical protein
MSVGLLFARSTAAGDKEPAPRSLAEDAQLLAEKGGKRWISQEKVTRIRDGVEQKFTLVIRLEPENGKPSGKVVLGVHVELKGGSGAGFDVTESFELVEKYGRRIIKVTSKPAVDGAGKPITREPRLLYYSIDGDTLTIREIYESAWVSMTTEKTTHFRAEK